MQNAISKFYDHVVNVTQFQGFLFSFSDLYGDGSMFENKRAECLHTYEVLKSIMIESELIGHDGKMIRGKS